RAGERMPRDELPNRPSGIDRIVVHDPIRARVGSGVHDAGHREGGPGGRGLPRALLPLELDAVDFGERLPDDLLEAAATARGPEPLPARQANVAVPDRLAPEQVHGASPAPVQDRGREVEDVVHSAHSLSVRAGRRMFAFPRPRREFAILPFRPMRSLGTYV